MRSSSVSKKDGSIYSEEKKLINFHQRFQDTLRIEEKFFDQTDRTHLAQSREKTERDNKFCSRYILKHINSEAKSVRNKKAEFSDQISQGQDLTERHAPPHAVRHVDDQRLKTADQGAFRRKNPYQDLAQKFYGHNEFSKTNTFSQR